MRFEKDADFVEISREGVVVRFRYGGADKQPRERVRNLRSAKTAIALVQRETRQLRNAGFLAVVESARASPWPDTFAALLSDPEDRGAWQVHADWLQEQNDPRGELILLQGRVEQATDPTERERVRERLTGLLAEYGHHWIGPAEAFPHHFRLTWDRGYLDTASLTEAYPTQGFSAVVEGLLRTESARLVRHLDLPMGGAAEIVAGTGPFPRLQELRVAQSSSWIALSSAAPVLESLTVTSAYGVVAPSPTEKGVAWPRLRRLRIENDPSEIGLLDAFQRTGAAPEELRVDVPSPQDYSVLIRWLESGRLDGLQRLVLGAQPLQRNQAATGAMVEALVKRAPPLLEFEFPLWRLDRSTAEAISDTFPLLARLSIRARQSDRGMCAFVRSRFGPQPVLPGSHLCVAAWPRSAEREWMERGGDLFGIGCVGHAVHSWFGPPTALHHGLREFGSTTDAAFWVAQRTSHMASVGFEPTELPGSNDR